MKYSTSMKNTNQQIMSVKFKNTRKVPEYLVKDALKYCEEVGADEIYNIADIGSNEYRIMYWTNVEGQRKMQAKILNIPLYECE